MIDLQEQLQAALPDRYTIERELGRGGMGTVFLARESHPKRQVAIKVLNPMLSARLGRERFLREVDLASQLTHPLIVPIFSAGEAGDLLYYVMPYVKGETLRERLSREFRLPMESALGIAAEVSDALAHAHRHNIVHRDIKPENILLHDDHAMVTDFGIARAVSAAETESLTETGMALGTPAYMSP
ncbi:serine/threonine-protein kinase, partial [Gemmatimonadota bacterium]